MKKSSNNLFWIISLIIVGVAAYWFGTAQVTAPQENIITPTETEKTVADSDQQKNITIPSDLEKNSSTQTKNIILPYSYLNAGKSILLKKEEISGEITIVLNYN